MNQKNNTILITGASGFAGSNLLPYLQNEGHTALGISRNPKKHEISYEVLSEKTWNNVKAMVHLAGKAHDLKKMSNDSEYFEINFVLTNINLYTDIYDETKDHELKLFLRDINTIKEGTLSFTPACQGDEEPIIIEVNKKRLETQETNCGESQTIILPANNFIAGANTIRFKTHASDDYAIEDIVLLFTRSDETTEELPGETFIIKKSESQEERIEDFDPIVLRTVVSKTFKINLNEIAEDITMGFSSSEDQGKIQIILNDHLIYDGEFKSKNRLILPKELLINGRNEISFVFNP